jgi:hypothetical protein
MDMLTAPDEVSGHQSIIDTCVDNIAQKYNEDVHPLTYDIFSDEHLFKALPDAYKIDGIGIENLMLHTSRFTRLAKREMGRRLEGDATGLFGEEVSIPETTHANGGKRRAESGYRINVDYLLKHNIDPTKVLFFRSTQPSDSPKPEWYWEIDYYETKRGLQQEISGDQRRTAVTLVATLDKINRNGGLIHDCNTDTGLSVRQILPQPFDQRNAIAIFR